MAVKVINEKWPAVIDQQMSEPQKRSLANKLIQLGFDIENTDNELIQISSNRDPRLKDGLIIVKFNDPDLPDYVKNRDPNVGVWFNGKAIFDPVIARNNWKDVFASQCSWSKILGMDVDVYRMVIDPEKTKVMRDKHAARLDAQKGAVSRYGADPNSYGMKSLDGTNKGAIAGRYNRNKFDKSGYIVNPNKYSDMLAELQINGAQEILNQAADTYQKLAMNIGKYGTDSSWGSDSYDYVMSALLRCFRDLNNTMKEMNSDESGKWGREFARGKVKSLLKDMRSIMKTAEKYLD